MKKILKGFSLIELLIVITIIGILAVVFLPKITSGPERARDAQRVSDVADIANAVEMVAQDNDGAYPDTSGAWTALTDSNFTPVAAQFDNNTIPQDPQSTNAVGPVASPFATTGAYYYRDYLDGFIIVADTETDKYSDGYLVGSALFSGPTFTDATNETGEDNVYVYYK